MKEKELEKLKKDAQHLQNKQNAIDNLLRLNIQPCKTSVDITTLRFYYLSTLVWPRCVQ
jgi:hypothetical protein